MTGLRPHPRLVAKLAAAFAVFVPLTPGMAPQMPAPAIELPVALGTPAAILPWQPAAPVQTNDPDPTEEDLSIVRWSVDEAKTLAQLSWTWSISQRRLARLNPGLAPHDVLAPGTTVRVHEADDEDVTQSIGAPNRGRLVHGIPMPEGDSWSMKPGRQRVYGTVETVRTLRDALLAYGRAFDDAPRVQIRDLSALRGGKIAPHRSHQSGRDVDIGFVLNTPPEQTRRVGENTFDREKNWFLVRALIDSGQVQSIYTSGKAKRWLLAAAAKELTADELPRYFDLISYERGHSQHMHVRFRCADEHGACQGRSKQRPKRAARPSA
ncbi:MAG: penicillin-insensitive murein endopeptidase [Nannocystaceae bacterium]|nr:penicillin-insensitive murein endopeptidase [Nannocystaceae bacterium]